MEDRPLLRAYIELGDWLMAHPGYSFGYNQDGTRVRLLSECSIIDTEPFESGNPEDRARAIEELLARRNR